jgi:hypothetical protein
MSQAVAVEVIQDFQYASNTDEMAVEQNLSEICAYERSTTLNGVEQGIRFEKIKKIVGRKHWMAWVAAKCPFSLDTVERYMRLAEAFAQNPQIADFKPSVAYELAAGGKPAIASGIELATDRGAITTKQAKEIRQSTVTKAPKKSAMAVGETAYVAIPGHDREGQAVEVAEVTKSLIRVTLPDTGKIVPFFPYEVSATPPNSPATEKAPKEKQSTPVDTMRFDLEMADELLLVRDATIAELKATVARLQKALKHSQNIHVRVLTGYNATGEIDDGLLKDVEMAAIAVS